MNLDPVQILGEGAQEDRGENARMVRSRACVFFARAIAVPPAGAVRCSLCVCWMRIRLLARDNLLFMGTWINQLTAHGNEHGRAPHGTARVPASSPRKSGVFFGALRAVGY